MIEIKSISELDDLLLVTTKVVLVFSSSWCGPCKILKPQLEKISSDSKYNKIKFCKIDIDECGDLSDKYKISSLPTTVFLNNGDEKSRITGADIIKITKTLENFK